MDFFASVLKKIFENQRARLGTKEYYQISNFIFFTHLEV